MLEESLGAIDRLESTISSLLALARHDARPVALCDVTALVGDRVRRWLPLANSAGRQLSVTGSAAWAELDADAIGHIVDVLLDNALRHGVGVVTVSVGQPGDMIVVDVADEGAAPLAQDPFAESGSDSAHGIGLRLARTLAESAGGSLHLLTIETTTFRLTLQRSSKPFT